MHNHPFIEYLVGLSAHNRRAALAKLRRGLGKTHGEAPEMFPIVLPWLSRQAPPAVQDAYFLVAALFGTWPNHSPAAGNLGDTLRRMAEAQGFASLERRFTALLAAPVEDLPSHLGRVIALARAHREAVNYERLLEDLLAWSRPNHAVQRRWAGRFWVNPQAEPAGTASPARPAAEPKHLKED
jgi:CRISPR system Cascade subunit CasB